MIVFVVGAYFLGAIPFGLLIARSQGVDIRSQGSGNIGATNVFRVMGKGWGLLTFLLDALKGFVPAFLFPIWGGGSGDWGLYCGLMAIVGHSFPVYLKFKGGKGVATSSGMLLGIAPLAVGIGLLSWMLLMLVFKYVSLASIVAVLVVAVVVWVEGSGSPVMKGLITLLSLLIIWLHRANIGRLLAGTENRFGKKDSAQ